MTTLSTEEILYLLYAYSYSYEEGWIIKSEVKDYWARDRKELSKEDIKIKIDDIYKSLLVQELIEAPASGRLCVTQKGIESLIDNLGIINYDFSSSKGPKVINALIYCIKQALSRNKDYSADIIQPREIDYGTFAAEFKKFFLEDKKSQDKHSSFFAIRSRTICEKIIKTTHISQEKAFEYFEKLKSSGEIFTSIDKDDEFVEWIK